MPDPAYDVVITRREGVMVADDYIATVTRRHDGKQKTIISGWRWFLRWQLRRKALDRAYKRTERYEEKGKREAFSV